MKRIDPKKYNLTSRTTLYKEMKDIFIIIDRKSRIIMKDGYRISEQAKSILSTEPGIRIRVATSAPMCSKTKEYLRQVDIEVLELNSLNISS
tara:strand:- start:107 stop:382 length:276 start_codon:yes stop_codon:yes gene_type:complete